MYTQHQLIIKHPFHSRDCDEIGAKTKMKWQIA